MTVQEPLANDFAANPAGWTASQLLHVEAELTKEYPNLSRHLIRAAVAEARQFVESRHGTVRMLSHARKHLAASAINSPLSIASDFRLPA